MVAPHDLSIGVGDLPDVRVSLPSHNRGTARLRQVAGALIELFPLDVSVAPGDSFLSLAERVTQASHERVLHAVPGTSDLAPKSEVVLNVIKGSLGRADFSVNPATLRRGLLDNGYRELAIAGSHVLAVEGLPALHRDPFDRVLVAQATVEGYPLLTADPVLSGYGSAVRLV